MPGRLCTAMNVSGSRPRSTWQLGRWSRALAGKTAGELGDLDQPHTDTYIADIGEGLVVLGEHPDAPGQVWHLPNDPDTRTTRQLVDAVQRQATQRRSASREMPNCAPRAWQAAVLES
jgi:nucleoside-diphosphate-sugar epimerase